MNADDLLGRSMKIDRKQKGPKILIFHTHSQEEFADSIPGDPSTSIVGIGDYLTELLNQKGIETIHDKGVYDIINGQLDRSNAYEYAEAGVRPILEANPTIEVAIDLHRDGVAEGTHLVTEVNGKPTAKIMYFNGLSRTTAYGDIPYLKTEISPICQIRTFRIILPFLFRWNWHLRGCFPDLPDTFICVRTAIICICFQNLF